MLFSWVEPRTWRRLLDAMPNRTRSQSRVQSLLPQIFAGVVVYHAARPRRIASYYERGLLLADRAATKALAREIFVNVEFPGITAEAVAAADGVVSQIDDNKAFVCLDARGFLDHAGHYLIYGSEHLCAIGANLGRHDGVDYRQVLKRFGTPTIFRLALPFEFISASDASELAGAVSRELRWVRNGQQASEINFTFRLRRPLPPECVLEHMHPTHIIDPLLVMTTYVFDSNSIYSKLPLEAIELARNRRPPARELKGLCIAPPVRGSA